MLAQNKNTNSGAATKIALQQEQKQLSAHSFFHCWAVSNYWNLLNRSVDHKEYLQYPLGVDDSWFCILTLELLASCRYLYIDVVQNGHNFLT